jgi:hypothetical protein
LEFERQRKLPNNLHYLDLDMTKPGRKPILITFKRSHRT